MKSRGLLILAAMAAALHADSPKILRASFPDGTGLEIHTETTGSSQINALGSMGIGPGSGSRDEVNRVVVDASNQILFAYNLEACRGATPDTVKIRIEPLSPAIEATMLKNPAAYGRPLASGARVPTVAAVREFAAVKIGEAVTLDILYNPATGEKIFDVLRPITTTPAPMSVTVVPARETISLKEIALQVNGHPISAPAAFLIGSAVRVDIPRHGTYIVAAYNPRGAASGAEFTAIAQAEGKKLSWTLGHDRVEITSGVNILARSSKGVLWVYHDSNYRPDLVSLQSADTVEWLLPKR